VTFGLVPTFRLAANRDLTKRMWIRKFCL
jgi:hypothetical protein